MARNLDWKTDGDIDWDTVRKIYRRKLDSFHNHVSARSDAPPEARLLFYTELNGGWNFNIVREVSDSEMENYGDTIPGWYDDPEGYDAAFALLAHDLEDIDAAQRINARFLSILTEEVEARVPRNFGFPASTRVTWKVHD